MSSAASDSGSPPLLAIVGNPNCGKTTLFNALTGLRQKVANYPGVTVEKKVGECFGLHGERFQLIDLPGAYSLNARSPDEAVLRDVLLGRRSDTRRPDRVVLVLDASNLERNLYLASQVLELGLPTIIALNMVDLATAKGWQIEVKALQEQLGVPVVPCQATTGKGLVELKAAMSLSPLPLSRWQAVELVEEVRAALLAIRAELALGGMVGQTVSLLEPLYLLSDHDPLHAGFQQGQLGQIERGRAQLERSQPGWEDRLADARYAAIERLCSQVLRRPGQEPVSLTSKLDRWLLHPVFGAAFVLGLLVFLFYLIFKVAEGPMGWIEEGFGLLGQWVVAHLPAGDLRDLMVDGAINGVAGVVVFLPQILILFFFIGLMEDTGYMARLAFLMDRVMSLVGLNGKAFLPFLSSYACAVPGIMATRTIDSPKHRLITILIAPLASCSARLPVYLLLISALMPAEVSVWMKALVLVGLYALGTVGAFVLAWVLNRCILRQVDEPMVLELPSYKMPSLRGILLLVWQRARAFLLRAGTVIFAISILIWAASTYPKHDSPDASVRLEHSLAGRVGHWLEPVIRPLGYDWKIGIGLVASFAAREVFVNTMAVVYAVEDEDEDGASLRQRMSQEKRADGSLLYTPGVCLSLLVFYVFAMQCVSTMAIVRRETDSWKWMWVQLAIMSGGAWLLALLTYQISQWW